MKVKLKTRHTHAGRKCLAGDEIEVSEADYDFLVANKVIDAGPASPTIKPAQAVNPSVEVTTR